MLFLTKWQFDVLHMNMNEWLCVCVHISWRLHLCHWNIIESVSSRHRYIHILYWNNKKKKRKRNRSACTTEVWANIFNSVGLFSVCWCVCVCMCHLGTAVALHSSFCFVFYIHLSCRVYKCEIYIERVEFIQNTYECLNTCVLHGIYLIRFRNVDTATLKPLNLQHSQI